MDLNKAIYVAEKAASHLGGMEDCGHYAKAIEVLVARSRSELLRHKTENAARKVVIPVERQRGADTRSTLGRRPAPLK